MQTVNFVAATYTGDDHDLEIRICFRKSLHQFTNCHAFVAAENPLDAQRVDFDYNFNDTFSLIHSDYPKRATFVQSYGKLTAHIISPVDLALMKISRFSERDRNDIKELVREGLIDRDELKDLANDALNDYVGNTEVLRTSLDIVLTCNAEKICYSLYQFRAMLCQVICFANNIM